MTEDVTADESGDGETEIADDGLPRVDSSDEGEASGQSLEQAVQTIAPKRVYDWSAGGLLIGLCNLVAILMVSKDLDNLARYGIEKSSSRFLYYIAYVFMYAIGPLLYLWQRRQKLLDAPTFDRGAYEDTRSELDVGKPVLVWASLGVFFLGMFLPTEGTVGTLASFCILASVIATPLVVYLDTRDLRSSGVVWGSNRWLHVIGGFLPIVALVYLFQRGEHVFYTALVKSTKKQ